MGTAKKKLQLYAFRYSMYIGTAFVVAAQDKVHCAVGSHCGSCQQAVVAIVSLDSIRGLLLLSATVINYS